MDIPKEKLQDFAHDELLRFAMDSTANNVYQQNRIEELEAENRKLKSAAKILEQAGKSHEGYIEKLEASLTLKTAVAEDQQEKIEALQAENERLIDEAYCK